MKDANGVWDLNASSPIVSTLDCIQAGGQHELLAGDRRGPHELAIHGRPDVQDVIVFFTDGGANIDAEHRGAAALAERRHPVGRPPVRLRASRRAKRSPTTPPSTRSATTSRTRRPTLPARARSPTRPASSDNISKPRPAADLGLHAEGGAPWRSPRQHEQLLLHRRRPRRSSSLFARVAGDVLTTRRASSTTTFPTSRSDDDHSIRATARRARREDGQAYVEFAFVLPILLLARDGDHPVRHRVQGLHRPHRRRARRRAAGRRLALDRRPEPARPAHRARR